MPSTAPDRIVCACSRVSAREITTAIDGGASTLEALAREVDAGTGCRTCHPELRQMLAAALLRRLHGREGGARAGAPPPASDATSTPSGEDGDDAPLAGFRLEPVPVRLRTRRRG